MNEASRSFRVLQPSFGDLWWTLGKSCVSFKTQQGWTILVAHTTFKWSHHMRNNMIVHSRLMQ